MTSYLETGSRLVHKCIHTADETGQNCWVSNLLRTTENRLQLSPTQFTPLMPTRQDSLVLSVVWTRHYGTNTKLTLSLLLYEPTLWNSLPSAQHDTSLSLSAYWWKTKSYHLAQIWCCYDFGVIYKCSNWLTDQHVTTNKFIEYLEEFIKWLHSLYSTASQINSFSLRTI